MFEIFISIDILNGKVVRLLRGDPSMIKVYSHNPLDTAVEIIDRGVRRIHIVDLEASIYKKKISSTVVELVKHIKDLGGFTSVGGGVREISDIEKLLDAGADRIVLGTAIYRGLIPIDRALEVLNSRAVASIDFRMNRIAIDGWKTIINLTPNQAVEMLSSMGFKLFLMTNIDLDGSLRGTSLSSLKLIDRKYRGMIIASGGIKDIEDLKLIRSYGYRGAVIGKAYYEGFISPEEVLMVFQD